MTFLSAHILSTYKPSHHKLRTLLGLKSEIEFALNQKFYLEEVKYMFDKLGFQSVDGFNYRVLLI